MTIVQAASVAEWQRASSRVYVPLHCSEVAQDFRASVEVTPVSPMLTLSRIHTGSVNVQRSGALAARDTEEFVLLAIQLASSGRVSQHGRDAVLQPGDAVLYETGAAYEIDHLLPGQHELIAKIPRAALPLPGAEISAGCGALLSREEPRLRIVSAYLRALSEDAGSLTGPGRFELARVALDLVTTLLRPGPATPHPPGEERLRDRLQGFVLANLGNPALTVASLADHHHLSVRAVYQAFAPSGEPPGAFIRRMRLHRAATLLGGAATGTRTISGIASECGFPDPSTFTRAFRRAYGVAPSEWAAQAGTDAKSELPGPGWHRGTDERR